MIATSTQLDDLSYSAEYAEYIMKYGSQDRSIYNGDTLSVAMEDGYLFDEFLATFDLTQE